MLEFAIIACKTLEDEVNKALEMNKERFQLYWIESGLHNYPDKLKAALQESIDSITDSDYIVLIFGLCGNALLWIESKTATLVVPRVDDCISLFLGGNNQRRQLENTARAYYLTKGWLRYENNIWQEYERSIERYGFEKTHKIFQIMLKHYTHLVVIETGAYDTGAFIAETKLIAKALGLEHKIVPAELGMLAAAINGNWEKGFALIPPGQKITLQDMGNCETSAVPQTLPFNAF
jgi:hypothetical protein